MAITIWDLRIGQKFHTVDGGLCEVITPTQDGKGLVARYLDGEVEGQEDFIFENEIEFSEGTGA
jgi:hypothetical protein